MDKLELDSLLRNIYKRICPFAEIIPTRQEISGQNEINKMAKKKKKEDRSSEKELSTIHYALSVPYIDDNYKLKDSKKINRRKKNPKTKKYKIKERRLFQDPGPYIQYNISFWLMYSY